MEASPQKYSLQNVLEKWKGVDLDGRMKDLDKQALEIANTKDSSVITRKELSSKTKTFRTLPDEEKLKQWGALLKAYQEEIDRLTSRSKFSETSFNNLYGVLAQAPDPVNWLRALMDESQKSSRITELELENRKYKTELEEFKKEFQDIQNQDVTIFKLKERLNEYEMKMDEIVGSKVAEAERAVREENEKTVRLLKEREEEIQRQCVQYQKEFQRAQHSLELAQSQLMDLKSRHDSEQSAKQSEMDMLLVELDRARSAALVQEREREKLFEQSEFTKVNQHSSIHPVNNSADLELEVAQKDIQISQLKEHIQKLDTQLLGEAKSHKGQLVQLKDQLEAEKLKTKTLSEQIATYPNPQEFNELKSQLEVFRKTLEFSSEDGSDKKTVERLLKEKTRKLETENMQLKVSLQEKETALARSKEDLQKAEESVKEMKQLVFKLEEDIAKGSTAVPIKTVENMLLERKGDETSMLSIVCKQRDRFKARMTELEAENKELFQKSETTANQMEVLRTDNLKLYEKIKYLQSYGSRGATVSVDLEANKAGESVESKYSQMYEESVNPFETFNRKEKYRRYKELNPAEKVVLNSGRILLATKYSRLFLFCYSVMLHFLVFATLYKIAHTTTEIHN